MRTVHTTSTHSTPCNNSHPHTPCNNSHPHCVACIMCTYIGLVECLNGGQCHGDRCECPSRWKGEQCQIRTTDTSPPPVRRRPTDKGVHKHLCAGQVQWCCATLKSVLLVLPADNTFQFPLVTHCSYSSPPSPHPSATLPHRGGGGPGGLTARDV